MSKTGSSVDGGLIVCAHPVAASAGAQTLNRGGNAFDAMVAVASTLNVVEPYMSGVGGQGLAILHDRASGRTKTVNFVPNLPLNLPVERLRGRSDVEFGPISIGVPGNLGGWLSIHEKFGSLDLEDVFAPAIAVAEQGYRLTEYGAAKINHAARRLPKLVPQCFDAWKATFLGPDGDEVAGGQLYKPRFLAETLKTIVKERRSLFDIPEWRESIVRYLDSVGGILVTEDFEQFVPVWADAISISLNGYNVCVPPPPCEGFQTLLGLGLLERQLSGSDKADASWTKALYLAMRKAAEIRIRHNLDLPTQVEKLLQPDLLAEFLKEIDRNEWSIDSVEQWSANTGRVSNNTTSFSIVDRHGNAVCCTQSLGMGFGSGVVLPESGISFNNFVHWADSNPDSPNRSAGGSPLPMCMAPTISFRDGEPVLVLGTPGGYGISQTQTQVIAEVLLRDMAIAEAIAKPRFRVFDKNVVKIEGDADPTAIAHLEVIEDITVEPVEPRSDLFGGVHGIKIDRTANELHGGADPRRDGVVLPQAMATPAGGLHD